MMRSQPDARRVSMNSVQPTGRVAFITGGASGIGLAVAGLLLRRGMKLVLMDLTEPALQAAAVQLGDGEVITVAGDVTRARTASVRWPPRCGTLAALTCAGPTPASVR